MKKLNIAIDVDDTISNTFEYRIKYVSEFYNIDEKYLEENDISYSTLTKEMKEKEIEFSKKYFEKVALNVPIKEDSIHYINKLKEDGHNIIVITARDTFFYKDPYKTTKAYLNKFDIPFDKLICNSDKVKECKNNNIDLLIDDSNHNCENVSKAGIKVLMFACKSNKNIHNFNKVYNWKEVYDYIKTLV